MKNIIKSVLTFVFMIIIFTSLTVIAQGNGGGDYDWTYYAQEQGYLPPGDLGGGDGGGGGGDGGGEGGGECNGIKLNTNFPIIGNCIEIKKGGASNPTDAFPYMVGALTKIIMSLILVVCFILVIYAGILWAMDKPKNARPILAKVAITILLLGFSGVILRLINPNFFG